MLKLQQGDCRSKTVLTASLFEAKSIPYALRASPAHFRVDYSSRPLTNFSEHYETTQVAFVDNDQCKLPDKTNAFLYLNMYKDIVWTSMPLLRKIALISGLAVIIQFDYCKGPKKRLREYLLEALARPPRTLIESIVLLSEVAATRIYNGVDHTVGRFKRGGCQARSKAIGSGPILVGVRAFESHPPHIASRRSSRIDAIAK